LALPSSFERSGPLVVSVQFPSCPFSFPAIACPPRTKRVHSVCQLTFPPILLTLFFVGTSFFLPFRIFASLSINFETFSPFRLRQARCFIYSTGFFTLNNSFDLKSCRSSLFFFFPVLTFFLEEPFKCECFSPFLDRSALPPKRSNH